MALHPSLERHAAKVSTASAAVRRIKPGSKVFVGTACATPRVLVEALEALKSPPGDVELVHFITTGAVPHDAEGRPTTQYRHRSFFVGSDVREAVRLGMAEYVPISSARVPRLMEIGRIPIDVALIQVTPPDEFGYVSLGVSVDMVAAAVSAAKLVIAEVNPAMPWSMGESAIHVSAIDLLVPVEGPMIEYVHAPADGEAVERIARYIAGIIDDGSTLQIGLGRIPNEALRYLEDRRDLGIHSDVITDAIIPLLEKGIVTGKQKTQHKGKIVTSFAFGTKRLYDLINRNPLFFFQPIEQVVQQIARYIAGIIDDGSTLQIGLGRIPNEALRYLSDRRDLGIHSDVITDAILPLLEKGILTGRAKSELKNKVVASFVLGSRVLYDIMDGNPLFSLHPMAWVANPEVIAAQHKMVSISQAFSIDLTGQVCSDQFEGQLYGGLGAQVDFVRGAARSKGGKAIVCMTSTTDDGVSSRIRPQLAAGEAATLARSDVQYVVTEYGIAYLHGKSLRERALSLIAISHPNFRDALIDEGKRLGYLEASCTVNSAFPYPVEDELKVALRNNKTLNIRPATVSDAGGVKSLFYGLPADDRYTRFFRQVKALSTNEVQKLCNLDYQNSVAFVAVHGEREHEQVVGHASYFVNPSTNLAETAFMVGSAWQGTGLGGALQRRLVAHAKGRGIRGFEAEVLPENTKMVKLARSCCENVTVQRDEDVVHVTMIF